MDKRGIQGPFFNPRRTFDGAIIVPWHWPGELEARAAQRSRAALAPARTFAFQHCANVCLCGFPLVVEDSTSTPQGIRALV